MILDLREVYEKFKSGEHITNQELKFAINEFSILEESLGKLGPVFYLPWTEVSHVLAQLTLYQESRVRINLISENGNIGNEREKE